MQVSGKAVGQGRVDFSGISARGQVKPRVWHREGFKTIPDVGYDLHMICLRPGGSPATVLMELRRDLGEFAVLCALQVPQQDSSFLCTACVAAREALCSLSHNNSF